MNPTLVVELSGDKTLEPHRLGGKAHSLNHLIQAGLPVPPAFCITAQAYRQFIEFAVPGALLDTGAPGNVRDMILSAAIPAPLDLAIRHACKQLGDGASLAVRSSALEEDGLTHSFAGQYDTYLHVRGMTRWCARCNPAGHRSGRNVPPSIAGHRRRRAISPSSCKSWWMQTPPASCLPKIR